MVRDPLPWPARVARAPDAPAAQVDPLERWEQPLQMALAPDSAVWKVHWLVLPEMVKSMELIMDINGQLIPIINKEMLYEML